MKFFQILIYFIGNKKWNLIKNWKMERNSSKKKIAFIEI